MALTSTWKSKEVRISNEILKPWKERIKEGRWDGGKNLEKMRNRKNCGLALFNVKIYNKTKYSLLYMESKKKTKWMYPREKQTHRCREQTRG